MKHLAVIPARSGSKGLKDKNIRELAGAPLLAYSVRAAQESGLFDRILLSTDSASYAAIGERCGASVPFLRSAQNASDQAGSWDAVREAVAGLERRGERYDTVTLLQPTSPLRTARHIREAFRLFEEKKARSVVSVCEAEHSPLWCGLLPESLSMDAFGAENRSGVPRQQLPVYYRINGAIYILEMPELYRTPMFASGRYAYIMERRDSVDIDDEVDFLLAEALLRRREENASQRPNSMTSV